MIFGTALFVACFCVLIMRDLRVGLLLFGAFWLVRSAGETLYFFLQQLLAPTHPPHAINSHLSRFKPILGTIHYQKSMIIMQVCWQLVTVASLSGIILLIIYWSHMPTWF